MESLISEGDGMGPGVLLGRCLKTDSLLVYDRFGPEIMNPHMVVMAGRPEDKTFFTKLMIAREAQRGVPVYVIDSEGDYRDFTRALGGEVVEVGSAGFGLDPFTMAFRDENGAVKRICSLMDLVTAMVGGDVERGLMQIIDHCLTGFYSDELHRGGNKEVLGKGGIRAFHRYLESERGLSRGGQRLADLLSVFVHGSGSFLFGEDAAAWTPGNAPVVCFDLGELAGVMRSVAAAVCAEVVWELAVSSPAPRLLVVDDVATVFSERPGSVEVLLMMVKRFRRQRLGVMTATGAVEEFLDGEDAAGDVVKYPGRSLLQNASRKMVFGEGMECLGLVSEVLGVSEDDRLFLSEGVRRSGLYLVDSGDVCFVEVFSTDVEMEASAHT